MTWAARSSRALRLLPSLLRQQEPWVFLTELKRDFAVKQVEMTAEKIEEDINVLLVVHPSNITDKTQYAIDQFVLRGGKLVALLDRLSVFDSRNQMNMQNMLQGFTRNYEREQFHQTL